MKNQVKVFQIKFKCKRKEGNLIFLLNILISCGMGLSISALIANTLSHNHKIEI